MKTNEILKAIRAEGGFNNYRRWNKKEIAVWVKSNYPCSWYVAKRVAEYL